MVSYYTQRIINMKKAKLKAHLVQDEKQQFIDAFKDLVILIKKDCVVIKHEKFGYELFKSKSDDKYWSYAITFTEPMDPIKPIYKHHWVGNAFVGYGFETIDQTIARTFKMMEQGPTANTQIRDYLVGWDEKKDRIILGWEEKEWSYHDYVHFQKWFKKNKVRIMAKQEGVKDTEDYNKESNKTALTVLLGKMQDPPKRPRSMVTIMRKTKETQKDWANPMTKRYIVGFLYVD